MKVLDVDATYCYIAVNDEGLVKIGYAKRPQQRIRDFNNSVFHRKKVRGTFCVFGYKHFLCAAIAKKAERNLHTKFKENRVAGLGNEVFSINWSDALNELLKQEDLI